MICLMLYTKWCADSRTEVAETTFFEQSFVVCVFQWMPSLSQVIAHLQLDAADASVVIAQLLFEIVYSGERQHGE